MSLATGSRGSIPFRVTPYLHEAFYSIACDYKIAHYLMWPLYRGSTEIEEPFAPYFELWTHGALPFFKKPGLAIVYVTGDEPTPP